MFRPTPELQAQLTALGSSYLLTHDPNGRVRADIIDTATKAVYAEGWGANPMEALTVGVQQAGGHAKPMTRAELAAENIGLKARLALLDDGPAPEPEPAPEPVETGPPQIVPPPAAEPQAKPKAKPKS